MLAETGTRGPEGIISGCESGCLPHHKNISRSSTTSKNYKKDTTRMCGIKKKLWNIRNKDI